MAKSRAELSAGPVHYERTGEGPPIVFVHGVFVNGNLWRKVASRLSDRYTCICPDWPMGSHPEPMHADADLSTPALGALVADFIAALDLNDVTLVGNDTGGAVCQLVMTGPRERIGRVVLTSCDAFEVFPPSPFGFLRAIPSIPGAAFSLAHSMRLPFARRLPIAYGWVMKELAPREILDSYTRPLLNRDIRRDAKKMLRGISKEHTLRAAQHFRDVTLPVLLAWAGDDKLFPLSLAERLSEALPNSKLEVVEGARTFIAEDRPEELAVLIDGFIRSSKT